jgi:hypothetical protein
MKNNLVGILPSEVSQRGDEAGKRESLEMRYREKEGRGSKGGFESEGLKADIMTLFPS